MADEKGGSTITDLLHSRTGLAAIILALTSLLLIKPSPLNSVRPGVEPGGNRSIGAPQDVNARLWQDPFQAVNDATKNTAATQLEIKAYDGKKLTIALSNSKTQKDHSPESAFTGFPDGIDGNQVTLMAVMMSASPTPETYEMRLRRRYALVSALAKKRYTPVDAEHIGYLRTNEQEAPDLPGTIPFEWFEKPSRRSTGKDGNGASNKPTRKVLVLWVDDTRFDRMPVKKTIELFNQVTATSRLINKDKITRIVMGPSTSGNLRAMALESSAPDRKFDYSLADKITFYASQATSADSEILKDITGVGIKLSDYLNLSKFHLVRTIADDQTVIDALVNELTIRHAVNFKKKEGDNNTGGFAPEDHIVLLSDWDTFYGRALPLALEKSIDPEDDAKNSPLDLNEHVHQFKYVRGIDGILPGAPAGNNKEPSRQARPESGSGPVVSDQPDGMSQKDYLRRLVEEIRKLDDRLQQKYPCYNPADRCGVSAIGVLGYDVYDKLMILRALRPYFPNKTFFTTDLSASYWSPAEMPYTHNLIVSSGYGLTLNPQLQKDIPPFRDSYQTSLYLAVLLALEKNKSGEIPGVNKPRIFEIGRNGPVDLSNPEVPGEADPAKNCARHISDCSTIHPGSIFEQSQKYHKTLFQFILTACGFVLLYLASWNVRKWVNQIFLKSETDVPPSAPVKFFRKFQWKRIAIIPGFLLVFVAVWWIANNCVYSKEPWLWFEGVSIWPSEILRLVALIASIALLHNAFRRIARSDEEIATAFGLKEPGANEQAAPGLVATLIQALGSFNNCSSIHKWQSTKNDKTWLSKATLNGLEGRVINVNQLWERYRRLGERKRRVCRSLLGIVPFIIFAWASIVLSGGMFAPVRGEFAFYADKIIAVPVVFIMLFLTMLVVDASRLCAAFITHLDETQSDWLTGTKNPSCTMIHLSNQWGLKPAHTAYWLDVQFVAQRTEAIQKLIWYPLIPLFFLAIARSPVFDDWSHPAGLIATLTILIVYLISCAFLLEYGAKNMRRKASKQIGEELRKLRGSFGSNNNPKINRLENMLKEIEGFKRGAFLPLFQQPWMEAVLALASGAGGLAWMGSLLGSP